MDWSYVLPFFGQVGTSLFNTYQQNAMNNANLKYQRERDAKNEALMRESWLRDDNAVTRRVGDLQNAGISPLLAAGSAAGNSGPVSMLGQHQDTAPQLSMDLGQAMAQGVGFIKTQADIMNQAQQMDLANRAQTLNEVQALVKNRQEDARIKNDQDRVLLDAQRTRISQGDHDYRRTLDKLNQGLLDQRLKSDQQSYEKQRYDLWMSKQHDVRSTDSLDAYERRLLTRTEAAVAADKSIRASLLKNLEDIWRRDPKYRDVINKRYPGRR